MLFILDCDLDIPIYFFYNPRWCCLLLIVTWTSLVSLFFYHSEWVLFIIDCDLDIPVYFSNNLGWVLFIPDCHLHIIGVFFTILDGCCLFPIPHLQHNVAWHGPIRTHVKTDHKNS